MSRSFSCLRDPFFIEHSRLAARVTVLVEPMFSLRFMDSWLTDISQLSAFRISRN